MLFLGFSILLFVAAATALVIGGISSRHGGILVCRNTIRNVIKQVKGYFDLYHDQKVEAGDAVVEEGKRKRNGIGKDGRIISRSWMSRSAWSLSLKVF